MPWGWPQHPMAEAKECFELRNKQREPVNFLRGKASNFLQVSPESKAREDNILCPSYDAVSQITKYSPPAEQHLQMYVLRRQQS